MVEEYGEVLYVDTSKHLRAIQEERQCPDLGGEMEDLAQAVESQGMEGVVGGDSWGLGWM